jgi:2-amino-4-hydroxy-6-hydroxymethyldihydropteridine diphosphokinase
MTMSVNFRVLTIRGWGAKYNQIAKDFGYSKRKDMLAGARLDSILKPYPIRNLEKLIRNKIVFTVGSGPSISRHIPLLKKSKGATIICADSAITPLAENGIRPHIIVTDLDGDHRLLKKLGRTKTVFVVHAHGDNIDKLGMVRSFANCVGSTQTRNVGRVQNYGGFTDGDRCVFLAEHFGARKIILLGMDFGKRIGGYSNTKKAERYTKLKKLERGKLLLEWLARQSNAELYTLSKPVAGFKKIDQRRLKLKMQ